MKRIILAIFLVFALWFGLIGNVFASYKCTMEANGCRFCTGIDASGGKYCAECCTPGSDVCVAATCPVEPTKSPGEHAYAADCGPTVPNRTAPITTDLCPGNLVALSYFCGGDTGCPYVCCPKGLPYLNHCDCKCYAAETDFECGSHSVCQVQPKQ